MTTLKLALPELTVGQAGKELTHNQALAALDQLVQAVAVDKDLATPPGSPANGAAYIVAATATGAWAGKEKQIAYWLSSVGAWSFAVPVNGWRVWVTDESRAYEYRSSAWVDATKETSAAVTIGYAAGAGGSVTQATSRITGVTLNKPCGDITLFNATTSAHQIDSFTLTNSLIGAGDLVVASIKTATGVFLATVTSTVAGSCQISIYTPAATGSEAPVIRFAIIGAASA